MDKLDLERGAEGDRAVGARRQRAIDELASLERQLDQAWPDPQRIGAELDAVERELAALRASVRALEGPRRSLDLVLGGVCAAALAFCVLVVYLLVGAM